MSKNVFISGDKIDLCVFNKERHLENSWNWINNSGITTFMNSSVVFPVFWENEEKWLEQKTQDSHSLILAVETKQGKHIGNISLENIDWISRSAVGGIMIGDKQEWNQGYATEAEKLFLAHAFRSLNLNRICAHIVADNIGSIKAAEKAGFQKEGLLREHFFKNNRYCDVMAVGILKKDWEVLSQ